MYHDLILKSSSYIHFIECVSIFTKYFLFKLYEVKFTRVCFVKLFDLFYKKVFCKKNSELCFSKVCFVKLF